MKGLFVNQVKNRCSIYESGVAIYNAMLSSDYELDYVEVLTSEMNTYNYNGYDFYVFNWHHNTLPIKSSTIQAVKGLKIGILLEISPDNLRPFMPEDMFDAYMVIDPTKDRDGKYFPFPRPLEKVDELLPLLYEDIPVFGTFGFLAPGKNYGQPLQVANKLGRDCVLRMNITAGTFTGAAYSLSIAREYCAKLHEFANPNVKLITTNDYMSKPDLIRWCSQNTLNIFPYYRTLPGLSATTDQAIVANRGIAVTNCDTFRHMRKYISYYPEQTYLQLSESTLPGIKRMQEDWSNDKFVLKFKELLYDYGG